MKTLKFRGPTGLYTRNSHVAGEFPAQQASNADNVSIWWRHRVWVGFISSSCLTSTLGISVQVSSSRRAQMSLVPGSSRILSHLISL